MTTPMQAVGFTESGRPRLAGSAAQGVLTPRVAEVLPVGRATDAHGGFEAHQVRGRLVLTF